MLFTSLAVDYVWSVPVASCPSQEEGQILGKVLSTGNCVDWSNWRWPVPHSQSGREVSLGNDEVPTLRRMLPTPVG